MHSRKKILHIIYNLGRGGAETMLVQVLKKLPQYHNIVVTIEKTNYFGDEMQCDEFYCLNAGSLKTLPTTLIKFRKLLKELQPHLVHSHLYMSNIVARLVVPSGIPLVSTIHTPISKAVDYEKWYIRFLDKLSYNFRKSIIVGVSNQVLNDYFSVLKINPNRSAVVYTFASPSGSESTLLSEDKFFVITVGSLRKSKNFDYLIDAFKYLREEEITLHIYGKGVEYEALNKRIAESNVNIVLKGQVSNIPQILGAYHAFVMPSKFEGCSVSVIEAMAARKPLLLSDIPSFREQCEDCAVYFQLEDPRDFAEKIKTLVRDRKRMIELGNKAYNRFVDNFTIERHVEKIVHLYESAINNK